MATANDTPAPKRFVCLHASQDDARWHPRWSRTHGRAVAPSAVVVDSQVEPAVLAGVVESRAHRLLDALELFRRTIKDDEVAEGVVALLHPMAEELQRLAEVLSDQLNQPPAAVRIAG